MQEIDNQDVIEQLQARTDISKFELLYITDKLKYSKNNVVMTRNQFHLLSLFLKPYIDQYGSWSIEFHPKNSCLKFGSSRYLCMKLVALSNKFNLFQAHVNGRFCTDLVTFDESLPMDTKLVLLSNEVMDNNNPIRWSNGAYLYAYNDANGISYEKATFIGGGRVYYEPSAKPLIIPIVEKQPANISKKLKYDNTRSNNDQQLISEVIKIYPNAVTANNIFFELYDKTEEVYVCI
jgi:hypothetical protein